MITFILQMKKPRPTQLLSKGAIAKSWVSGPLQMTTLLVPFYSN